MTAPLCFILMPFGVKDLPDGRRCDFNRIYQAGIEPGIIAAELEPIRADHESTGGSIHGAMYERLLLCDFAIADLTGANVNVYYELGVRHAVRPATTLPIMAAGTPLPFDVNLLRCLPYELDASGSLTDSQAASLRDAIAERLVGLRRLHRDGAACDSPVFQLVRNYGPPDLDLLGTQSFVEQQQSRVASHKSLQAALRQPEITDLERVADELLPYDGSDPDNLVALLKAYRSASAWRPLLERFARMPAAITNQTELKRLAALAHNKLGEYEQAIAICEQLLHDGGNNPETLALLAAAYKARWLAASADGATGRARGLLGKAIDGYARSFDADIREAHPGINLLTLLDIRGNDADLAWKERILPVVALALLRRPQADDYWHHATVLELAVLASDPDQARQQADRALAADAETWMHATTAGNLRQLLLARLERGEDQHWLRQLIAELETGDAA